MRSSAHQSQYYQSYAMDDNKATAWRSPGLTKCPWIEYEFADTIDISSLELIFPPRLVPDDQYFKPGVQFRLGNTTTSMEDLGKPDNVDETHPLIATYRQVMLSIYYQFIVMKP